MLGVELSPSPSGEGSKAKDAIFAYCYAVLHDPLYREKYALNLNANSRASPSNWLPEDERDQLRFEFAQALERLKQAALAQAPRPSPQKPPTRRKIPQPSAHYPTSPRPLHSGPRVNLPETSP